MSAQPTASSPPRARRLAVIRDPRDWLGPAFTIVALVAVILARPVFPISSASILLLVAVAGAAAIGGIGPGLVSAAITIVFVLVAASTPGHVFDYDANAIGWLAPSVISAILIAVIVGDIRRRLEREQGRLAERQASRHERALTETAADAMFTIAADGTIRSANPAAVSIFGYPVAELIGRPSADLLAPSLRDAAIQARERYLETGIQTMRWSSFETVGCRADGSEFPIEGSFGQYAEDGEHSFTWIIRDVSERKALENQLLQAQRMEAVGQLAGGVAHDFNNMLMAIGGFAELIAEDPDDAAGRAYAINAIRAATERAAGLTRQLLAFSGRQRLEPVIVSLNDTIARVEPLLQRLLGEHVELVVHPVDEPWLVLADPNQLETVVLNLAINGRDAMPSGGTLTIETANLELDGTGAGHPPTLPAGAYAVISVTDTGIGMDPAILGHVFEPFFTTKEFGIGTGLGLSSANGVIEQSGGRILVDSQPGKGTTFRVYLPRASGTVVERTAAPVGSRASGSGTILVAEDEPVVGDLILTTLRRAGYQVLVATDGRRAMELLDAADAEIDLLVSDVVMPHIGGLELVDLARARRPSLPIILISGYSADLLARDAVREGLTVLPKPFTALRLTEVVRATLAHADPAGHDVISP